MIKNILRLWLAAIFLFFVLVLANLGMTAINQSKKNETYKELDLFADALAFVQAHYVDETKPRDLIYGALSGMMSSLDPHCQFLNPQEYEELKADTAGEFGGVGIEITLKDELITIITPVEGTPAWEAGLQTNDRIVKIDKTVIRNFALNDAVRMLRGKPGTEVTVVVWREKEGRLLTFKLKRAVIEVNDIKDSRILEDSIGYIRLVEFREDTPVELDRTLEDLRSKGMDALIFDLRNNPGGLLDKAVEVAERFTPQGEVVVSLKGRDPSQNVVFKSRYKKPYLDIPIVLLVNAGSASGSEIVAGCFKDYRRAILLGEQTFGKGSVQMVLPLRDGSALKMTTSKYYTPSGVSIHEKGITPDVVVAGSENMPQEKKEQPKNGIDNIFDNIEGAKPEDEERKALRQMYYKDRVLERGVDIIKGIKIYQRMQKKGDEKKA